MSAMLARVSDPGSYQAFQHFLTDAPWETEPLWRLLRRRVPARTGTVILDGTGFSKHGTHSVGVQRQYSGTSERLAIARSRSRPRSGPARRPGCWARGSICRAHS
jgi:SRSO17 transposase